MGNNGGILRDFLDSKAGVAFGKALGELAGPLIEAMLEGGNAPLEPVTGRPNPPIPTDVEVTTTPKQVVTR